MWTKGKIVAFVVLVLGFLDSLYLTYETIEYKHPNYCPLNGCEIVMSSPYSKFLGIPVSVLGLIWFSVALISLRWFTLYVVLWFLALSFVTYLIFTDSDNSPYSMRVLYISSCFSFGKYSPYHN